MRFGARIDVTQVELNTKGRIISLSLSASVAAYNSHSKWYLMTKFNPVSWKAFAKRGWVLNFEFCIISRQIKYLVLGLRGYLSISIWDNLYIPVVKCISMITIQRGYADYLLYLVAVLWMTPVSRYSKLLYRSLRRAFSWILRKQR